MHNHDESLLALAQAYRETERRVRQRNQGLDYACACLESARDALQEAGRVHAAGHLNGLLRQLESDQWVA